VSVLAKPFIGELGHELMYWQALLRHMKFAHFKAKHMIVGCLPGHETLYEFADQLEVVPEDLITPELYHTQSTWETENSKEIEEWFLHHVAANKHDILIDPDVEGRNKYRHGYHDICGNRIDQQFVLFQPSSDAWHRASGLVSHENFRWGKYVVVYPRHKPGIFATRNWEYWREIIQFIKQAFEGFKVVVVGVESLTDPAVLACADVDLILPPGNTDLDLQIGVLANACFAVTPISGCTFLSLLSGCPTFIIGPGKCDHHLLYRNVFQTRAFYYSDWNDKDQMPTDKCLMDICRKIEIFGIASHNGRFSV
jgi:hypothetical protein